MSLSTRERSKQLRDRRRAAGQCISCPLPAEEGQLRCRVHRERNIKRAAKSRREAAQLHRCKNCDEIGHNSRTCMEGPQG